jgi:hypothetical protein
MDHAVRVRGWRATDQAALVLFVRTSQHSVGGLANGPRDFAAWMYAMVCSRAIAGGEQN